MFNWNGAIFKHRDYKHGDFAAHLRDNSGTLTLGRAGKVTIDPITQEPFDDGKEHDYLEALLVFSGKEYKFFVPMNKDGSQPSEETIWVLIQEYFDNPLFDGRPRPIPHFDDETNDDEFDDE